MSETKMLILSARNPRQSCGQSVLRLLYSNVDEQPFFAPQSLEFSDSTLLQFINKSQCTRGDLFLDLS